MNMHPTKRVLEFVLWIRHCTVKVVVDPELTYLTEVHDEPHNFRFSPLPETNMVEHLNLHFERCFSGKFILIQICLQSHEQHVMLLILGFLFG